MALLGLTESQIPKEERMKNVLINFFRHDLGNYGLDEIRIAFHLAITGQLGIDTNTYGPFSAKYVGGVMAAYENHIRKNTISKFRLIESATMQNEKTVTPEEALKIKHDFFRESIIKPWLFYLKKDVITFGINPFKVIYDSLVEIGLINLTTPQKLEIRSCGGR